MTLLPLPQYGSVAQLVSTRQGRPWPRLERPGSRVELQRLAAGCGLGHHAARSAGMMVHKNSPIHDFKDLEGHTIAAQTGATWLKYVTLRYNLHQVRQIPSTLSIANFLADPNYVQQIFITSEPFFAQQAGADVRTLLISSSGYDPYRVSFTTRDFAAQHPDLVAKFVRASIRGWKAYLSDPGRNKCAAAQAQPGPQPRAGSLLRPSPARRRIYHRQRSGRRRHRPYDRRPLANRLRSAQSPRHPAGASRPFHRILVELCAMSRIRRSPRSPSALCRQRHKSALIKSRLHRNSTVTERQ